MSYLASGMLTFPDKYSTMMSNALHITHLTSHITHLLYKNAIKGEVSYD